MIDKVASQGVYPTTRVAPAVNADKRQPSESKQNQTSAQGEQTAKQEVRQMDMLDIVDSLNKFMKPANSSLKFEFHEDLNEYYVTVIDEVTQEVIKEIPPKKLLDMYAAMTEYIGLMVDKKI